MVEYSLQLDSIFGSLADPTRRAILQQVALKEMTVSAIATAYDMTLAAISKHLKILEKAQLVRKRREGKQQIVQLSPAALQEASTYLQTYEQLWNNRLDSLEQYLSTFSSPHDSKPS